MNTNSIGSHDALMRAFAVAEMVTASLPETPSTVDLSSRSSKYAIRLYFHCLPKLVEDFANRNGVVTTVNPAFNGRPGNVYTSATVQIDGVTVEAWTLVDAEDEVAAPHRPTDGELAEQQHLIDPLDHALEALAPRTQDGGAR